MRHPQLDVRSPFLLLGEGSDEKVVFRKVLDSMGLDRVQVLDYGGRDECAGFLGALAVGSYTIERILVTRDADESSEQAAQSLRDAISRAQFRESVLVEGFVIRGASGVGALEDLFLDAIAAAEASRMACVDQLFACAGIEKPIAKARLHAWLALQDEPWKRLREAIHSSPVLAVSAPSFGPLRERISRFFAA